MHRSQLQPPVRFCGKCGCPSPVTPLIVYQARGADALSCPAPHSTLFLSLSGHIPLSLLLRVVVPFVVYLAVILFTMFLPRSTFQLAALCLTLFSSLIWFSSSRISSSSVFERDIRPGFLHGNRAPAPAPCQVQTEAHNNVVVDEPADDPIWDIQNRTLGVWLSYSHRHRSVLTMYCSFKKFMPSPCLTASTKGTFLD